MRIGAEISRESRRSTERLEQVDADRTRLAEQLNELEVAERVLARFGRKTTRQKIQGEDPRKISMQSAEQERTSLPLSLCYDLFEVDRLGREARRSPVDVNRLATAIDAMAVVLHTPFFSPDEATGLADAPAVSHTGIAERRRRRRAKTLEYKVEFGAVSAFIGLMSNLVTDDTIRSFIAAVARDGVDRLFSNFQKKSTQTVGFLDDDSGEEVLGFLTLLNLSVDISGFLEGVKDKGFGESMLSCLKPLYMPELERFSLLVREASRKAMFAEVVLPIPSRRTHYFCSGGLWIRN